MGPLLDQLPHVARHSRVWDAAKALTLRCKGPSCKAQASVPLIGLERQRQASVRKLLPRRPCYRPSCAETIQSAADQSPSPCFHHGCMRDHEGKNGTLQSTCAKPATLTVSSNLLRSGQKRERESFGTKDLGLKDGCPNFDIPRGGGP